MDEIWYTDKKKGICHGVSEEHFIDYCGRHFDLVNGDWIEKDRQFSSREELLDALENYIQNSRWDDIERLRNVSSGYCVFRVSGR